MSTTKDAQDRLMIFDAKFLKDLDDLIQATDVQVKSYVDPTSDIAASESTAIDTAFRQLRFRPARVSHFSVFNTIGKYLEDHNRLCKEDQRDNTMETFTADSTVNCSIILKTILDLHVARFPSSADICRKVLRMADRASQSVEGYIQANLTASQSLVSSLSQLETALTRDPRDVNEVEACLVPVAHGFYQTMAATGAKPKSG